jgi:hypothetical protein
MIEIVQPGRLLPASSPACTGAGRGPLDRPSPAPPLITNRAAWGTKEPSGAQGRDITLRPVPAGRGTRAERLARLIEPRHREQDARSARGKTSALAHGCLVRAEHLAVGAPPQPPAALICGHPFRPIKCLPRVAGCGRSPHMIQINAAARLPKKMPHAI